MFLFYIILNWYIINVKAYSIKTNQSIYRPIPDPFYCVKHGAQNRQPVVGLALRLLFMTGMGLLVIRKWCKQPSVIVHYIWRNRLGYRLLLHRVTGLWRLSHFARDGKAANVPYTQAHTFRRKPRSSLPCYLCWQYSHSQFSSQCYLLIVVNSRPTMSSAMLGQSKGSLIEQRLMLLLLLIALLLPVSIQSSKLMMKLLLDFSNWRVLNRMRSFERFFYLLVAF